MICAGTRKEFTENNLYKFEQNILFISQINLCILSKCFDLTLIRCTIDSFLTVIRCGKVTENRWYYKS